LQDVLEGSNQRVMVRSPSREMRDPTRSPAHLSELTVRITPDFGRWEHVTLWISLCLTVMSNAGLRTL